MSTEDDDVDIPDSGNRKTGWYAWATYEYPIIDIKKIFFDPEEYMEETTIDE